MKNAINTTAFTEVTMQITAEILEDCANQSAETCMEILMEYNQAAAIGTLINIQSQLKKVDSLIEAVFTLNRH